MPRLPIRMPQLGESMAEATVVSVLVEAGTMLAANEDVIEVETDKAIMTVTTPCAGRLVSVKAAPGESYAVGAVLGHIDATEKDAELTGPPAEPKPETSSTHEPALPRREETDPSQPEVEPVVGGQLPVPASATGAGYLSPRMKARMLELGLNASDLAGVAGTGAGGRVTIQDFEAFIKALEHNHMTEASAMRIAVADSMRRSWTRPLATVGRPVQLDKLLVHRASCNPKPGPTLYAIRALALALADDTSAAGRLIGSRVVHPEAVDIGFAVEVNDGVLVPVIREADKKPLADLVSNYMELLVLARERRLPSEATRPGIATVTNFGTFGIVWATPIPLPEQNLVLGMGRGVKKPLWDPEVNGFVPVTEAELTLSFDHRLLDGGGAGRLLARVADLLQTPESL